eukprot:279498_1
MSDKSTSSCSITPMKDWKEDIKLCLLSHGVEVECIDFNLLLKYTDYDGCVITDKDAGQIIQFIKSKRKIYTIGVNVEDTSELVCQLSYDVAHALCIMGYIQYWPQVKEIPFFAEGIARQLAGEQKKPSQILINKLKREATAKNTTLRKILWSLMYSCGNKKICNEE